MKALIIQNPGPEAELLCMETGRPEPGAGQVLIKMAGTALHFADVMLLRGRFDTAPRHPLIPGWDVAGTVEALGPGVSGLAVGQPVVAYADIGTHAEYTLAAAAETFPVPEGTDLTEAAAVLDTGLTAVQLLTMVGRLQQGETLLVHAAAGGVGTMVGQAARILGAGRIIGTVGSDEKAALARDCGYDHVINYRTEAFAERVLAFTGGKGADLILDSVGGETFGHSLRCLADFGRLVNFGIAAGQPGRLSTDRIQPRNQAIIGYSNDQYRPQRPHQVREAAEQALAWYREGRLRPIITERYPLDRAGEAYSRVENRRTTGRVILTPTCPL